MFFPLIIIIILIYGISSELSGIITLEMQFNCYLPQVILTIENDNIIGKSCANTYLPYTVIDYDIKKNSSLLFKEKKKMTLLNEYTFSEYQGNLVFNGKTLLNYIFYHKKNLQNLSEAGLSLIYKYVDESLSLIYQMYNQHIINKKLFSFEVLDHNLKGNFHIGGIPEDNHLKMKYRGICKVNDEVSYWGCNIKGIKYNNNSFVPLNVLPTFHTGFRVIYLSPELLDIFTKEIFGEKINQQICKVEGGGRYIRCDSSKLNEEDTIEFNFGSMKVKFSFKELSDPWFHSWTSIFQLNPFPAFDGIPMLIGFELLQHFRYTVFNYDEKQIEFYSNTVFIESDTNALININEKTKILTPSFTKAILVINIVVCLLFIIAFAIIKAKKINLSYE